MKQFKISLIISLLFSAIAFTGVFAAENFKNSIMAIEFEPASDDAVNMVISTKIPYSGVINPIKKDANTYVIMLPDTQSLTLSPDYSKVGSISSVNVRTMAGTQTSSGYTKITVTTAAPINLAGMSKIYTPKEKSSETSNNGNERNANVSERINYERYRETLQETNPLPEKRVTERNERKNTVEKISDNNTSDISEEKEGEYTETDTSVTEQNYTEPGGTKQSNEIFLVVMGIILIITCSIFFYVKAKNKLTQIAGENLEIDTNEEKDEKPKPGKKSGIRKTIKTLDKKYANPSKMPVISEYTQPAPQMSAEKSTDDMNIVDLDELFNEQLKNSDNNDALDDFLSEFSFEEEIPEEKTEAFDEETFQEILKNDKIRFSKSDMERIKNLLKLEINDETLRDIKKYAVSNPIKSKSKKLEEMVANLSISNNISFDKDDILALNKLMNVEIDNDFVSDLRTDSKRTAEMEKEILESRFERKKPSEIITLSVSEFLPDLEDVMKHPEKYEDPEPEKVVVNAEDLLKSIENVTFKPFDDGTRDFEILNDFDDEPVAELYSEDFKVADISEPEEIKPAEIKAEEPKPLTPAKPEPKPAAIKPEPKPEPRPAAIKSKPEPAHQKVKPMATTSAKPASGINKTGTPLRTKTNIKCLLDGKTYDVVSSVALGNNIGCHLAKDDEGYVVLQYYENKLSIIKQYKSLKSETIQARLSEKNPDGSMRYIIRIGMAKFIADVQGNCINYVMDL